MGKLFRPPQKGIAFTIHVVMMCCVSMFFGRDAAKRRVSCSEKVVNRKAGQMNHGLAWSLFDAFRIHVFAATAGKASMQPIGGSLTLPDASLGIGVVAASGSRREKGGGNG